MTSGQNSNHRLETTVYIPSAGDFSSLLVTFLLRFTFARGFFVAFRGPHFGQILRVLALEKSSKFQYSQVL